MGHKRSYLGVTKGNNALSTATEDGRVWLLRSSASEPQGRFNAVTAKLDGLGASGSDGLVRPLVYRLFDGAGGGLARLHATGPELLVRASTPLSWQTMPLDQSYSPNLGEQGGLQSVNLVTNPSFETDQAKWSANAGIASVFARQNGWAAAGSWSCRCTATTTAGGQLPGWLYGANALDRIPVVAARTYSATARINILTNTLAGASGQIALVIRFYDVHQAALAGTDITATTGNNFTGQTTLSATGTSPANAAWAQVLVFGTSSATSQNFDGYLDAVLMCAGSPPSTYFDGSFTNARWTGPSHASASELWDRTPPIGGELLFTNCVRNPRAYNNITGWTNNTTNTVVSRNATAGSDGGPAARAVGTALTGTPMTWHVQLDDTTRFPISPNQSVGGRARMKVAGVSGATVSNLQLRFVFYDAAGVQIGSDTAGAQQNSPVTGTWYDLAALAASVAPANAATFYLLFVANLSATGATITVDTENALAVVNSGGVVPPYFDGSTTTSARWTGTPHGSTSELGGQATAWGIGVQFGPAGSSTRLATISGTTDTTFNGTGYTWLSGAPAALPWSPNAQTPLIYAGISGHGLPPGLNVSDLDYARFGFATAEAMLSGVPDTPRVRAATCEWHGTKTDPERGMFCVVNEDGPLADLVGERLQVTDDNSGRSLRVYCHRAAPLDSDLSLTRRAFLALGDPPLDELEVSVEVLING